eukprot:8117383-Lingulodinium_polyedra.AAC.1
MDSAARVTIWTQHHEDTRPSTTGATTARLRSKNSVPPMSSHSLLRAARIPNDAGAISWPSETQEPP